MNNGLFLFICLFISVSIQAGEKLVKLEGIKIKADNSIYFAINRNDFEIKQLPFVINYNNNNIDICSKNEVTIDFKLNRFLN